MSKDIMPKDIMPKRHWASRHHAKKDITPYVMTYHVRHLKRGTTCQKWYQGDNIQKMTINKKSLMLDIWKVWHHAKNFDGIVLYCTVSFWLYGNSLMDTHTQPHLLKHRNLLKTFIIRWSFQHWSIQRRKDSIFWFYSRVIDSICSINQLPSLLILCLPSCELFPW